MVRVDFDSAYNTPFALRTLCEEIENPVTTMMTIDRNSILNEKDVTQILMATTRNPNIRYMHIHIRESAASIQRSPEEITAFVKPLKVSLLLNYALCNLSLTNCTMSHASIVDLVRWITNWTRLKDIFIQDRRHTLAIVDDITHELIENKTLEIVKLVIVYNLSYDALNVTTLRKIKANLDKNSALQYFTFGMGFASMDQRMEEEARLGQQSELYMLYKQLMPSRPLNGRVSTIYYIGDASVCTRHPTECEKTDWVISSQSSLKSDKNIKSASEQFARYIMRKTKTEFSESCRHFRGFEFVDINMAEGLPEFITTLCLGVTKLTFTNCNLHSVQHNHV
jgi:hypothetical protein